MSSPFGEPPAPTGTTSYLGVPAGYAYLPRTNRTGFNVFGAFGMPTFGDPSGSVAGAPVLPRYMAGDEYSLASMPPEQLAALQQQMATSGLIGSSTKIRVGLADDSTISAFKDLLSYANVHGVGWQDALNQLMTHPQITANTVAPNPAEEDTALRQAAQRLIGHDPTPLQLQGFRPYYEALTPQPPTPALVSRASGGLDSGATGLTPGGPTSASTPAFASATTSAPTLDTAAEQYLQQSDAGEIHTQRTLQMYSKLLDFIKGDGTIAP